MNINFKLHSLKTNGLTNIVLFALLFLSILVMHRLNSGAIILKDLRQVA